MKAVGVNGNQLALRVVAVALAMNLPAGWPLVSAAPANPALFRQKLLRGDPLALDENAQDNQRTIDATWIREAILKPVKIEIRGAIIAGVLDLTYATVERPLFLVSCKFQEMPNFSDVTFKDRVVLSRCVFLRGGSFQNATFQADIALSDSQFWTRTANFTDVSFFGNFNGRGLRFSPETPAVFRRVTFTQGVDFRNAVFENEACFRNSRFGAEAQFQNVRFNGNADFFTLAESETFPFVRRSAKTKDLLQRRSSKVMQISLV